MSSYSIWGPVQSIFYFRRGVRLVSTASHGGLMISEVFAKKHIPEAILEETPFASSCYQFEEDCALNIPLFFCPSLLIDMVNSFYPRCSREEKLEHLQKHIHYTIEGMNLYYLRLLGKYPSVLNAFHEFEEKCSSDNTIFAEDVAVMA